MNHHPPCPLGPERRESSRRDVVRLLGRGAGLAGIGALVAVLARRWLRRGPDCRTVPPRAVCRRCAIYADCSLLDETSHGNRE